MKTFVYILALILLHRRCVSIRTRIEGTWEDVKATLQIEWRGIG